MWTWERNVRKWKVIIPGAWSQTYIVEVSVTASVKFIDECWSKLEIGSMIRISSEWRSCEADRTSELPWIFLRRCIRLVGLIELSCCMSQNPVWNNNHHEPRTSITNIQTPQLSPSSNLNHYFISHDCDLGYAIMSKSTILKCIKRSHRISRHDNIIRTRLNPPQ